MAWTCRPRLRRSNGGYRVETDWRPVRVELVRAGVGWVDVHPVVFDEDGHGRQAGFDGVHFDYPPSAFDTGSLGEIQVACLSRQQQPIFHTGYEPRSVDLLDVDFSMRWSSAEPVGQRQRQRCVESRPWCPVAGSRSWATRPGLL
jgi:hypothetical protein